MARQIKCEECMWLKIEDIDKPSEEGCRKTIFRDTMNATGDCPYFMHRKRDTLNIQRIEIDERTDLCFDGVQTWIEQRLIRIKDDVLQEKIIEVRLYEASILKLAEILGYVTELMRQKK